MSDSLFLFVRATKWPKKVVAGTIWRLFSKMIFGVTALFMGFSASLASADNAVELAPGLSLVLPDPLSIHYVPPSSENESALLIGYIEGLPSYFVVADRVTEKRRASVLWEKLEMEIRGRADRHSFETGGRGIFTTTGGAKVWYRFYRYSLGNVAYRPVYYLVMQGESSYWVTLTVVGEVSREVVKPIADAVIKRVTLSDRSPAAEG